MAVTSQAVDAGADAPTIGGAWGEAGEMKPKQRLASVQAQAMRQG